MEEYIIEHYILTIGKQEASQTKYMISVSSKQKMIQGKNIYSRTGDTGTSLSGAGGKHKPVNHKEER